jgi:hypothetical protein
MTVRPVGAELHADRLTGTTKQIAGFSSFVKAPKNDASYVVPVIKQLRVNQIKLFWNNFEAEIYVNITQSSSSYSAENIL